ncbi:hypothetical protein [Methylocystis bryophila]|nr:hypothetical protein [Methylocystis bryophila]
MWWTFMWRTALGWLVLSSAAAFILGFFSGELKLDDARAPTILTAVGFLVAIVWSFFVMRMIQNKSFGDFRLVLVRDGQGASE